MSGASLEWSPDLVAALEQALAQAHGRRQTRRLSLEQVRACAAEALAAPLKFAWRHAGEVPDPRGLTTLVLAVATGRGVAVGVAEVRAMEPSPARAFRSIPAWDRYDDAVNALAVQRWAARAELVVPLAVTVPSLDGAALLEAIRARPRDDEPRLMLADWLSERGDPRGEFIAVQCELAAGSPRADELEARAAALLGEHRAEWERSLPKGLRVERYERGFASTLAVSALEAVPLGAQFAAGEVLEELIVSSANPNPAVLAATSWLSGLRRLSFVNPGRRAVLSLERLELLLSSRSLRALEGLAFEGHCLRDEGFEVLAKGAGAAFPQLVGVAFEVETVTARGLAALVAAKWFAQVQSFSLSAARSAGPEGVEAFVEARSPGSLRSIRLDDVNARTEGAVALAGAKRLSSVKALSLASNRIGPPGAQALMASPYLVRARIDLQGNQLGAQLLAQLARRGERD